MRAGAGERGRKATRGKKASEGRWRREEGSLERRKRRDGKGRGGGGRRREGRKRKRKQIGSKKAATHCFCALIEELHKPIDLQLHTPCVGALCVVLLEPLCEARPCAAGVVRLRVGNQLRCGHAACAHSPLHTRRTVIHRWCGLLFALALALLFLFALLPFAVITLLLLLFVLRLSAAFKHHMRAAAAQRRAGGSGLKQSDGQGGAGGGRHSRCGCSAVGGLHKVHGAHSSEHTEGVAHVCCLEVRWDVAHEQSGAGCQLVTHVIGVHKVLALRSGGGLLGCQPIKHARGIR
jgi:hypothetical protein